MAFYPTASYPATLKGTTLIMPIVSQGNLPQLAVDLLVSSLGLERVGILDSSLLIPVAGGREDGKAGITTPLEVYGKQGFPFHFVQQRSPVIKSYKRDFIELLVKFIETSAFASVLILTGVDLSNRDDSHMHSPAFHLLPPSSSSASLSKSPLSKISSILPHFNAPSGATLESVLPSSGITPLLLKSLPTSSSFPATAVVLQYVLEGDNRHDAFVMATIVARIIGLAEFAWKEPGSWSQGLFGTPHDQTLFG